MACGAVCWTWSAVGRDPRAFEWYRTYSTTPASPQGPMIIFSNLALAADQAADLSHSSPSPIFHIIAPQSYPTVLLHRSTVPQSRPGSLVPSYITRPQLLSLPSYFHSLSLQLQCHIAALHSCQHHPKSPPHRTLTRVHFIVNKSQPHPSPTLRPMVYSSKSR